MPEPGLDRGAFHQASRGTGAGNLPGACAPRTAPDGELLLEPVALFVRGARGRVDLEAFPSQSRVKLLLDNGTWQIMTDSNVPLRQPWTEDTFVQLARDLLSA